MTDEIPPMTVLYNTVTKRVTVNRWQRWKRKPWLVYLCAAIIIGYLLVALLAPWLAPHGEAEVLSDQPYAPWGQAFWLGTDQIGRDVFSRLIYGARNSVGIAVLTTLLAFAVGASLGIFAAVRGGWVDSLLSSAIETLMAVPQLILALILLAALGPSIPNIILIIAVINATQIYRLARTTARNVVVMDFVEAARLRGEGIAWILRREILPNILPALIAEFGLRFCFAFLTISALSFLGLGIQPPSADWGTMVREGATFISYGDITPLIPAGAIALLTLAVNVVVDHFLDPTDEHRP
ncbi:ABC transporter permease [Pseudomonas syringae]|uniref:ABC transporter permease n=1 Tax=Pseudomonas syringae TaxID=317 RepID=UPI001F2F2E86|nr:ABC transporter permease [Pseudomonas syringae]MCF5223976.1 ABC transporter permease subunit [Pseudomonas syringae]MCF5241769.1 ABC transporter permease subunit [Pseudomonas syringae]